MNLNLIALFDLKAAARGLAHDLALFVLIAISGRGFNAKVKRPKFLGCPLLRVAQDVGHGDCLRSAVEGAEGSEGDDADDCERGHHAGNDLALAALFLSTVWVSTARGARAHAGPAAHRGVADARRARHGLCLIAHHARLGGAGAARGHRADHARGLGDIHLAPREVRIQGLAQLVGRLEAVGGVLLHAAQDDALKVDVEVGVKLRRGNG